MVVAVAVVADPAEATAAVVVVAVVEAADLATAAVVAVAVAVAVVAVEAALAGMALSISLCLPSEFSSEESSNIISVIIGFWFSGTVGRLLS